ncbi:MAG: ribosomal RNA small subunit methyltransferase A, partial [Gemmatimonadales bacterium]|nr:ribosomal RNA small subunit methyltransferase A [Gemmatimonadales bacterium]
MPRAKRRLGQHFLSDPGILRRIVDALDPDPDDVVLEIGPGRGSLTAVLVERGADLTAIERDPELVPSLEGRFPTVEIVQGDALAVDWSL